MIIYKDDIAKRLYYSKEIPLNSIGVFQSHVGEWLFWYTSDYTYNTGFTYSQPEAIKIAKENFKPLNNS